jgi:galactokinase
VCAVDHAAGLGLSPPERAAAAHRAETDFVGLACGIMDPWVSTFGVADHALRIDCRSLGLQAVPLPGDRVRVLVANSGVRRALVAGGYGDRRAECEAALRAARELGVVAQARALRDVGPDALPALVRALPARLARRARHVITENARVDAVCEALDRGELERVGALLGEGMRSLRDDFEVSIPELDFLCERGDAHPGVLGSRLTGAGFGGCTLHLVRPDAADEVADWIADGFARRFGRRPAVLAVRAAAGARVSPL